MSNKLTRLQKAEALTFKHYRAGRAKKAANILAEFYDRADIETSVCDIIADLMHLCEVKDFDFLEQYERGREHFNAELLGGEHG